jgi:hypothetical protein
VVVAVDVGADRCAGVVECFELGSPDQSLLQSPEVPLGGIKVGPDELQVTVAKEQVESAPNIELHGEELSQADESALYHHFELNYTPPDSESGRRLARR